MSSEPKVDGAVLTGVSETALLTLKVRATEARRPDGIIDDPMAIELVDAIEYDFAKFGYTRRQDMALRALAFDDATRAYLVDHPAATVVALAEGLQTSFYRIAAGDVGDRFRWLTVDLPPIDRAAQQVAACVGPGDGVRAVRARLRLDGSVGPTDSDGVFITAEGLLMYLQPTEAMGLITECARRFPGGRMMFDLPPSWFACVGAPGHADIAALSGSADAVRHVGGRGIPSSSTWCPASAPFATCRCHAGRGTVLNAVMWTVQRIPLFDPVRPALTLLEFG